MLFGSLANGGVADGIQLQMLCAVHLAKSVNGTLQ